MVTGGHCHAQFLCGYLGYKLRSSCLHGRDSTYQVIFPAIKLNTLVQCAKTSKMNPTCLFTSLAIISSDNPSPQLFLISILLTMLHSRLPEGSVIFTCYLFYATVSFCYTQRWLIQQHKMIFIEKKAFHDPHISKYMVYTYLWICVYLCVCVYIHMYLSTEAEKEPIDICWINLPTKVQAVRRK